MPALICIVPPCGHAAESTFVVERSLRLAGRDWLPGEDIDLCPAHEDQLRRTIAWGASREFLPIGMVGYLTSALGHYDWAGDIFADPLAHLREWTVE